MVSSLWLPFMDLTMLNRNSGIKDPIRCQVIACGLTANAIKEPKAWLVWLMMRFMETGLIAKEVCNSKASTTIQIF